MKDPAAAQEEKPEASEKLLISRKLANYQGSEEAVISALLEDEPPPEDQLPLQEEDPQEQILRILITAENALAFSGKQSK